MPLLEQLMGKSKDLTVKAKDLTEQTKLKNMIKIEREKIDTLYQAIGKLYYENIETAEIEPYADIINTIRITVERIEEYEQKINMIKTKYICPNCKEAVGPSTQFCKKCGTKITKDL